jgi:hypothetical protein
LRHHPYWLGFHSLAWCKSRYFSINHTSCHSLDAAMITPLYAILLGAAGLVSGLPTTVDKRTVTSLNEAAFEQAQQRDNTATRAFSAVQIKARL